MVHETAQILSNEPDTDLCFRIMLRAPAIASLTLPGQFVHARIASARETLLRRPFSVFKVVDDRLVILCKAVGTGTAALSRMRPGEELSLLGPLGHGFTVPESGAVRPLLVAGGYGMAALYMLAERSPRKGIVFVGGRRRIDIVCETDFRAIGWDVRPATEDGSYGERGLVTLPLRAELERRAARRKLFACGPTPMLMAVAELAKEFDIPAEVSLDERMCCGVGACLTCVVPVKSPNGWEYERACTEGPVFEANRVAWERLR